MRSTGNAPLGADSSAVPAVATSWKPSAASFRQGSTIAALSLSLTETKTVPASRQAQAGAELRLGEGAGEAEIEPHDLAGRFHLRPQDDVDAGEAGEGEDRFLDRGVAMRGAWPDRKPPAARRP